MAQLSALPQPAAAAEAPPTGACAPSAMLESFSQALLIADQATYMHCQRVAGYAVEIARELGFDAAEVEAVRLGAALHDVGKTRVPAAILHKAGRLTDAEFEIVRQHPAWGLEMLDRVECPAAVREMVGLHHEKYDGSGYPERLSGDQIPIAAAIICVADVYDALITRRSYRQALPARLALLEMALRQRWWHPEVYAAFCRAVGRRIRRRIQLAPARRLAAWAPVPA